MKFSITLILLFQSLTILASEPVLIGILSSASKPQKLGENFHDNDSEGWPGNWDDIESHIRFGAQLFSKHYCSKEIVLKDYDTQGSIEGTVKAIKDAEHDGTKVIVGFVTSSQILTINQLLPNRKIPIITLTATHNDVAQRTPPTLQLSYNDKIQGVALGETVLRIPKKLQGHILFLTDVTNPYSVGLSKEGIAYLKSKTIAVTEYEYAAPLNWLPKNWSPQKALEDLKTATAIVMTGEGKEVLEAVTHLSNLNHKYILIGGDGWYRGNVTQYVTNKNTFIPDTITLGHWAPRFLDKSSQEFAKAYRDKFKANPGGTAAASHDAVKAICQTWKAKGSLSFESFMGIKTPGLTGIIHFDSNGRQDIKKPVLYWHKGGSYHDERL